MKMKCIIIIIILLMTGWVECEVIRVGENSSLKFYSLDKGKLLDYSFVGSAKQWKEDFLWVVLEEEGVRFGNFLHKDGSLLLTKKLNPYLDAVVGVIPEFRMGLAHVKSDEEKYYGVGVGGIIGETRPGGGGPYYSGQDGKYSVFTKEGVLLSNVRASEIIPFLDGLVIARSENKWGVKYSNDTWLAEPKYDHVERVGDNYFQVQVDEKIGVIDLQGEVIYEPQFSRIRRWVHPDFHVISYLKGDKWGLINLDERKILFSDMFDSIYRVLPKTVIGEIDGLMGIYDFDGNILLPSKYSLSAISNNPPLFAIRQNRRVGVSDEYGNIIIPIDYSKIYERDCFLIYKNSKGFGLYDYKARKNLIDNMYQSIMISPEAGRNYVVVKSKNKNGWMDIKNNYLILDANYDFLKIWGGKVEVKNGVLTGSGDLVEVRKDGYVGLYTVIGKEVLSLSEKYTKLPIDYEMVNGFGVVEKNHKKGLINLKGEIVLDCLYEEIGVFSENTIAVKLNGKWGYVAPGGSWIIQPSYEHAKPFKNSYAAVKKGGKYGLIDLEGRLIVPFIYFDIGFVDNGIVPVSSLDDSDQVWGLIGIDGSIKIPIKFESIEWIGLNEGDVQFHGNVKWAIY